MNVQNIKQKLGILFVPFVLIVCFIIYKLYRQIRAAIKKETNDKRFEDAAVIGASGTPINLLSLATLVYDECFNTWISEDETKIIKAIQQVRLSDMRQFSQLYNQLVAADSKSYLWYHKPTDLPTDMAYFLGSRVSEIQAHLNSI